MADSGERWDYSQLVDRSNRCAHFFRSLGLASGDTISILLENRPEYLALCWAAKNIGLHYVGIGTQLTAEEAAYIVEDSDSRLLIASEYTQRTADSIVRHVPRCACVLLDHEAQRMPSLASALDRFGSARPERTRRGASMLYSSGTTGRPKGVRVALTDDPPETPPPRHAALVSIFDFHGDTVFVNPGPLYHVGPQRFSMTVHRAGGTVVLMRKFDPLLVLRCIDRSRVTHGLFVPTMFTRLLRARPECHDLDHSSLRAVVHSAAPCPVEIKERMLAWWGPVIYELYGGTEGAGTTVISPNEWLERKGSVGKPMPGCEVHIVDDAGEELPPRSPGRVFLGSARRFEYYKDPAKTAAGRHPRGWTTLGDIGYVDEDGYLYLTDRESDMIISGGINIYPRETENVLLSHPLIADVAVIGVPNAEYGEEAKAVVQLESAATPSPELASELIAYCRERLSHIKCPRSVAFVGELPRRENGKLYKRLVKEQYWRGHATRII